MGWRNDQCRKVCRIIDNFLANRPTERDSLIVAVQKAFDALEQAETNCSEIPNNSDTISRQAAVNIAKELTITVEGYEMHNQAVMNYCAEITQLPPAQPEHCGDAVSRNAIVQKLNKMDRYVSTELRLCDTDKKFPQNEVFIVDDVYEGIVERLPSVQPKQNEMIKEIRKWINSGNRGIADYFIVDRIEEIINSYEIN